MCASKSLIVYHRCASVYSDTGALWKSVDTQQGFACRQYDIAVPILFSSKFPAYQHHINKHINRQVLLLFLLYYSHFHKIIARDPHEEASAFRLGAQMSCGSRSSFQGCQADCRP